MLENEGNQCLQTKKTDLHLWFAAAIIMNNNYHKHDVSKPYSGFHAQFSPKAHSTYRNLQRNTQTFRSTQNWWNVNLRNKEGHKRDARRKGTDYTAHYPDEKEGNGYLARMSRNNNECTADPCLVALFKEKDIVNKNAHFSILFEKGAVSLYKSLNWRTSVLNIYLSEWSLVCANCFSISFEPLEIEI